MCLSSDSLLFHLFKGADFKSSGINNLSKNYKHDLPHTDTTETKH